MNVFDPAKYSAMVPDLQKELVNDGYQRALSIGGVDTINTQQRKESVELSISTSNRLDHHFIIKYCHPFFGVESVLLLMMSGIRFIKCMGKNMSTRKHFMYLSHAVTGSNSDLV